MYVDKGCVVTQVKMMYVHPATYTCVGRCSFIEGKYTSYIATHVYLISSSVYAMYMCICIYTHT